MDFKNMPEVRQKFFDQDQIRAISKALGNTNNGLTGSEITDYMQQAEIDDIDPSITKWKRLCSAFCTVQDKVQNRTHILEFIRCAMKPANFINALERYNTLRVELNRALAFCGLEVQENGLLVSCKAVSTLTEAEKRVNNLKLFLEGRGIHDDVIKFCKAELLVNNYFHAVLEAVKSVFDKLRKITNNTKEDGHKLADACLGGKNPVIKINSWTTESEKSEQAGFLSLVKGVYSMFRGPVAHDPKIYLDITQKDAEDLFTLVSMIHRRLDKAFK